MAHDILRANARVFEVRTSDRAGCAKGLENILQWKLA
jgi:hypothetical protein